MKTRQLEDYITKNAPILCIGDGKYLGDLFAESVERYFKYGK